MLSPHTGTPTFYGIFGGFRSITFGDTEGQEGTREDFRVGLEARDSQQP